MYFLVLSLICAPCDLLFSCCVLLHVIDVMSSERCGSSLLSRPPTHAPPTPSSVTAADTFLISLCFYIRFSFQHQLSVVTSRLPCTSTDLLMSPRTSCCLLVPPHVSLHLLVLVLSCVVCCSLIDLISGLSLEVLMLNLKVLIIFLLIQNQTFIFIDSINI